MADEITQRLGFDASKAIQELGRLRGELNNFKQTLQSVSGSLRKFPSTAMPAIKAFNQLATAATNARIAVQGVASVSAAPAGLGASAQQAAVSMGGLAAQSQLAAQRVSTAVPSAFGQASQAMAQTGQVAKTSAAAVQAGSGQTTQAAKKAADALNKTGAAGKGAANSIAVSWKTLYRVVQVQLIVRALSALISAFSDCQSSAIEFSTAVAEASTIAGGNLGSLDQMNASVVGLSRSLGEAAIDVAEGTYQTLSNQVVEAADSFKFANEAAKLSIATNSELRSAVNALSSVMNSYNLDVSETGRVSDVLFKTIELGRLRLSEFGDVLGRVSPLTAALGIRYEEMAAAIAALTQKGVPAHTAITQLTQVSQKLLRPTEKLQELYREWGVETGPEAIRRFGGLQGVLLKMKDATAGNSKEFADLLGRVRAMVGALNLTSNEANALTEALDKMETVSGTTDEALRKMRDSVGRQATEAWNNLNTSMTEVGQTLLKYTTPLVKATDFLVQNMKYLGAAAVGAAAGLAGIVIVATGLPATFASLTLAATAFTAACSTMLPLLIAVAAAIATLAVADTITDSLDKATEITEKAIKQEKAMTAAHAAESQLRIQTTRKEFEERRKLTGEYFSAASQQYRKDFDLMEISSKAIGRTLDATLDTLMQKRADAVKIIKNAVLDADNAIKNSAAEVAKTVQTIQDARFTASLKGLSDAEKATATLQRAEQARHQADLAYSTVEADAEAVKAARAMSYLAEERAVEAVNQAEKMGGAAEIAKAEKELARIRSHRVWGEKFFQFQRQKLQEEAHKQRLTQIDEEGAKLELLLQKIRDLADPLTESGALKKSKVFREDMERVAALIPEFERQLDAAFDFNMFEKLGVTEGLEKIKTGLKDALSTARIDWAKVLQEFQQTMSARTFEAPVVLKIQNEYIIEEFVKKFGEIDLLGDPGKFSGQMDQVLEDIIVKVDGLQEVVDQSMAGAMTKVETALARLTKNEWYTWWDGFQNKLITGMAAVADAQLDSSGQVKVFDGVIKNEAATVETLRQKLIGAATTLKQCIETQTPLSKIQAETILQVLKYAQALENAGKLSKNMGAQGVKAFTELQEAADQLAVGIAALEELGLIPEGSYERAKQVLKGLSEDAGTAADAQKNITTEADKTNDQLTGAKQTQQDMPAIALQVEQGLATETAQAKQLRTELEGASKANAAIILNTPAAPGAPTPGAPVTKPVAESSKVSVEELERQALAARQLVTELITVDEQFGKVSGSVGNLTEAMGAPLEVLTLIQETLALANGSIQGINDIFIGIIEPINLANEGVGNLITALNDAATATGTVTQAAMNWNTQLQGCAVSGAAAAQAMQAAAAAAIAAARACALAASACAGGGVGAVHGGRYFQVGGRGTDKIPAWLSAGEFVINARSARNFFPQLQAMNAGQQPVFRDQGGSVTNVGDINVTVQGGDSSSQTIRDIASGLRRELRRKTTRLY